MGSRWLTFIFVSGDDIVLDDEDEENGFQANERLFPISGVEDCGPFKKVEYSFRYISWFFFQFKPTIRLIDDVINYNFHYHYINIFLGIFHLKIKSDFFIKLK